MRAYFGRKMRDIADLEDATLKAQQRGDAGEAYRVVREVELGAGEYGQFVSDFLQDRDWISPDDGGTDADGTVRCIRVRNREITNETVLVNSEGYGYPRYTALDQETE